MKSNTSLFLFLTIFSLSFGSASALASPKNLDCRKHIAEIVCPVNPVDTDNPYATRYNRPCLPGSKKYIKVFQEHFDHSNAMIQKMYCSLEKIWVENSFLTTADASPIYDESNNLISAAIGISKVFIENPPSLDNWLSMKEEMSFGKKVIIQYKTNLSKKKYAAVHYALNHEFGHLFDYANKLNRYNEDCNLLINPEDCKPQAGSWGEISWMNGKTSLPSNNFSIGAELCFYTCHDEYMDSLKSSLLFDSLTNSGFQSTYASVNPKEDWAEAFALSLAIKEENLTWEVETLGKKFNMRAHFDSELLAKKRKFVSQFLNSKFIYPGEKN